uniref:Uncharacterized protein n=1 Tax=Cucumis melo TaxID=3656 RepID=A0A9I9E500_CUCME
MILTQRERYRMLHKICSTVIELIMQKNAIPVYYSVITVTPMSSFKYSKAFKHSTISSTPKSNSYIMPIPKYLTSRVF